MRRTSSIETTWPEGFGKPMLMQGRARDLLTPADGGAPTVLAEDHFTILASPTREILSIEVSPDRPHAQGLVGVRAGGASRMALNEIMAEERVRGTPLFLLLDDFAGASLVAGWVWSRWIPDWSERARASGLQSTSGRRGKMEGVCTGFAPGSSALEPDGAGEMKNQNCMPVPSMVHPDDPLGWHELRVQDGVGKRRARRVDVWREGDALAVDIGFQDSGTSPAGGDRIAIHEYMVKARAEGDPMILTELSADPRILPFAECPGAPAHAQRMVGTRISDMRAAVLDTLPGILGCTHLNDVLRSMAEAPILAKHLG